jgi:hypothetical protein
METILWIHAYLSNERRIMLGTLSDGTMKVGSEGK